MGKRVIVLFFVFTLAVGSLSVRMLTISGGSVSAAVQTGNTLSAVVGETRGYIYDRHMQPLVNAERELMVAVKPTEQALNSAGAVLGNTAGKDALYETVENGKIAVAAADAPLTETDAKTVSRIARYSDDGLAVHLVGYINADGDGVCGLEQYYNDILKNARGVLRARCGVDAKGRLLDGAELQFTGENYDSPAGVQVTLDREIQHIAEEALQKFEIGTGAVVVLDTETSEILAMASVPEFSQMHPETSLDAADAPFVNRAITPYSVGSVFKAVVAAAAIENGTDESYSYTCTGAYTIGETVFQCHVHEGHGKQNLSAATANSCNPYFIDLALHTGRENVCAMCKNRACRRILYKSGYFPRRLYADLFAGFGEFCVRAGRIAGVASANDCRVCRHCERRYLPRAELDESNYRRIGRRCTARISACFPPRHVRRDRRPHRCAFKLHGGKRQRQTCETVKRHGGRQNRHCAKRMV